MKSWKLLLALTGVLLSLQPSYGAIVLGGRATNGTLDNSGTNKNPAPNNLGSYTGQLGVFLATAISPKHFITASHIGDGGGGGTFIYADGGVTNNNYSATIVGSINDLTIWQISGPQTFSHWINIYTGSNEVGNPLVALGNGTPRGNPVNTPNTSNLAGWEWGAGGTLRSWGTNTVSSVVNPGLSGNFAGDYLYFTFDRRVDGSGNLLNPDNVIFSGGDSGGPTFVLDPNDNQWKLAGVNSLVDQVSQTANGPGYNAALFDARGFFDGPNELTGADPIPLGSYATRISSRADYINGIIAVPEPGSLALMSIIAVPGLYVLYRNQKRNIRSA